MHTEAEDIQVTPITPHSNLLYSKLVLPPHITWNGLHYTGSETPRIYRQSLTTIAQQVDIVTLNNLIAVVAPTLTLARKAAQQLKVEWTYQAPEEQLPEQNHRFSLFKQGQFNTELHDKSQRISRTYQWSDAAKDITQSYFAQAFFNGTTLSLELPFGHTAILAFELSALLNLPTTAIQIQCTQPALTEQEIWISRNLASAVALIALTQKATIMLELTQEELYRHQQQLTCTIDVHVDEQYQPLSWQATLQCDMPSIPPYAALLKGQVSHYESASPLLNGQSVRPPYHIPHIDIGYNAATTALIPDNLLLIHSFAQESLMDELAALADKDPIVYRLDLTDNEQTKQFIMTVGEQANWSTLTQPATKNLPVMTGRGFAYSQIIDQENTHKKHVSAWVADVEYDANLGHLQVKRIIVGQDTFDTTINKSALSSPANQQITTNKTRSTIQQVLNKSNSFDQWGSTLANTAYDQTEINIIGQHTPSLQTSIENNQACVMPAAAAISNAIFNATGVRLQSVPLDEAELQKKVGYKTSTASSNRRWKYGLIGGIAAIGGLTAAIWPFKPAITPIAPVPANFYSAETIERGRLVAIAGDCMVCHTAEHGQTNVGGRKLETPFGDVYSTNITPSVKTGIGSWSFEAFDRAMRQGIHQDGHQLYPAFPYTAFAKVTSNDMQALYAYLMSQPAVEYTPPKTKLSFPFSVRPLLSVWNSLFHENQVFTPNPDKSVLWNRGAYLVEGLGHCAACHSPRNSFGAEKTGSSFLSGAMVDGWEAPALNHLSKSPTPWTENDLFTYLKTGFSPNHGVATGPMAPVITEMSQLPEQDIKAIAHYLSSLNTTSETPSTVTTSVTPIPDITANTLLGKNIFQGSCAACHQAGNGPTLYGVKPLFDVNTNIHSDTPDNLIKVILEGIQQPAQKDLGYMPSFANSLNDAQITALAQYLRSSFAPDKQPWTNITPTVQRIRHSLH